ncbi:MAG: lysophospholipid acyltransferase family protein [bacterium]|nr:lysophospholipid acyltransferase family protein [bacterium]
MIKVKLVAFIGWFFILVIGRSLRLRILGMDKVRAILQADKPVIWALWHGRHFILVDRFRNFTMKSREHACVMASRSRDGELLAGVLSRFGFQIVRASSSKGATTGFLELISMMKTGSDVVLAVDGPRGPREQVKSGVVLLAQKTGAPIIPISASAKRYKQISSWDRYLIPFPFTQAVATFGTPIMVPPDANHDQLESARLQLEQELISLTQEADAYFE